MAGPNKGSAAHCRNADLPSFIDPSIVLSIAFRNSFNIFMLGGTKPPYHVSMGNTKDQIWLLLAQGLELAMAIRLSL